MWKAQLEAAIVTALPGLKDRAGVTGYVSFYLTCIYSAICAFANLENADILWHYSCPSFIHIL